MSADLPPHSDNVDEELRRVRLALDSVYAPTAAANATAANVSPDGFQQRQTADRYLTSFQQTPLAWMVCDRLLADVDTAQTVEHRRFFAAQTLHKKCRTDAHELPTDTLPSLRDSLLQHFSASLAPCLDGRPPTNVALTTRLAMALAALSVQMGWITVVTDLMGLYRQHQTHWRLLLFFLRALPEECASDRLYLVQDNFRYSMRDQLIANSLLVFHFLQERVAQEPARVWQVLHFWIRYVPVQPASLAETPLLPRAVQMLTSSDTTGGEDHGEAAADVLVEVLRMYPSHHAGNTDLVRVMIPLLSQLPLEQVLASSDEDLQRSYCRVVTEMGESYLSWILSPEVEQARPLVQWILQCASRVADKEIASFTLHFWYRFVTDLELLEPYEWRQDLVDAYTPHLLDFLSVCAQHLMMYPTADEDELTTDRLDDWHKHRFHVSETLEDCCRLLGDSLVMKRMSELFRTAAQQGTATQWQGIEACLACMNALHKFVPSDESDVLPAVFQLLPQLPTHIAPLRATASRTIGKYAAWLAAHPTLLPPLLPFLAHGLGMPQCSSAAAVAIKELCGCSYPPQFDIAMPVMQLYQEVSSSGQLAVPDELQILEGVCKALSRQMQASRGEGARACLEQLVQPMGQRLASNLANPNGTPLAAIADIDRLTTVVHHLKLPLEPQADGRSSLHPMVAVLQSLWTVLSQISQKYVRDFSVAEKTCRLYKYSLRSCDKVSYLPLLNPLLQQLMQAYQQSHQSPYLYAASICLTEYGTDPAQIEHLYEMVAQMAGTTFGFMRSVEDFGSHPDIIEEFFYLMDRMMKYCAAPLVRSSLFSTLFQCAAMSMQVDHSGVNKGTLKFFESSLQYALSLREKRGVDDLRQNVERVFQEEGRPIVINLVRALMGDLPCYSSHVPDMLWYGGRLCPVHAWLSAVLEPAPWPSASARKEFLAAFTTGLGKDEFRIAVRSFETACARERRFRKAPVR
jgi:transportin-3